MCERPIRDLRRCGCPHRHGTLSRAVAVILVEGVSDQLAVEALAARLGRDLAAERVRVVAIGGAGNVRRALAEHSRRPCGGARRRRTGRAISVARAFESPCICNADLEDELIRCLGVERVQRVIEEQGELATPPDLPGPARVARPPRRGAAAALPRHPRRAQDPVRAGARRRARPQPRSAPVGPRTRWVPMIYEVVADRATVGRARSGAQVQGRRRRAAGRAERYQPRPEVLAELPDRGDRHRRAVRGPTAADPAGALLGARHGTGLAAEHLGHRRRRGARRRARGRPLRAQLRDAADLRALPAG